MKDFLEELEIGESKVKLSKEEIKSILAENGKYIKTETDKVEAKYKEDIENYQNTIEDLKSQIENAPKSDEMESLKNKIAEYEQQNADRKAREEAEEQDKILTRNIEEAFGDRKFINEYTKNAIMNEVKSQLSNKENAGKSAKDVFESIIKDKTDIFENGNKPLDMSGMGDSQDDTPKTEIPTVW